MYDYNDFCGDSRRCPIHPHVLTSSADGMFDGLCGECETEMDARREDDTALDRAANVLTHLAKLMEKHRAACAADFKRKSWVASLRAGETHAHKGEESGADVLILE